jgi:hypothetical protein
MKRNWLGKMEKLLSKKNMVKKAEVDFQIGNDSKTGNAHPEGWETKVDAFIQQL